MYLDAPVYIWGVQVHCTACLAGRGVYMYLDAPYIYICVCVCVAPYREELGVQNNPSDFYPLRIECAGTDDPDLTEVRQEVTPDRPSLLYSHTGDK
jgi:hypothetical protein